MSKPENELHYRKYNLKIKTFKLQVLTIYIYIYITRLNIQIFHILPKRRIYVSWMDTRTNNDKNRDA
jgi:hypothetical protein